VIAFGDSITNAGGELQWGVALQSWALWTARGLGLPYSPYAVDGAVSADVVRSQIPASEYCTAGRDVRYDLGCLYVGTNDIVRPDFDEDAFEVDLDTGFAYLRGRCDRVISATLPLNVFRPYSRMLDPHLIERTNRTIERVARRHQVLVLNLRRFGGRTVMMADDVHPTAFGQVAIAEAALALLAADGMEIRVHPWELVRYSTTWRGRLRGDLSYGWRSLKQYLSAWRAEALLRVGRAGP
jgi:lysophospholipase L1-like esterase